MTRLALALALACLAPLVSAGCARHVVVGRDVGRVDGARSLSSNSDPQWTIRHEPDPSPEPVLP
jgi:hypothetical protein